ncbi:class II fructose-bisphosphate aldolase [Arthrospiribacter ruber]|uniref:Class II fructose-bisphosphate aldolase n=1 Tax=Arthrospiribacter ruber TaxID=2487934 RepID=A0A951IYG1_9BACT|nr:class II fructose-bisphosphate aldolase [Arthrospiribacter ruber]MBW3469530.1 class II fructose-bisphosphate aldolase [Arthrospiribacter ruber]
MKITTKELFQNCYGKYGIAAINVFTMEQVLAVFEAAQKADSPVIIQTTPVARDYANPAILVSMTKAAAMIFPKVVYALHLDHGYESHLIHAIDSGEYTSVMIDASHDDFEKNVKRTCNIVKLAHAKGISVEAELGVLSGVEDDIEVKDEFAKFTNPKQVVEFVDRTSCDSLAIAVGTSHGAYKFSGKQGIRFDILKEIQDLLPGYPLVLHGGSSVDPEEIDKINSFGGALKTGSRGVSDKEIQNSINFGVCKINIATDLRVLWTRVHRDFFQNQPDGFDPLIPGKIYKNELIDFLLKKFKMLGSEGMAKGITEVIDEGITLNK